MTTNELPKNLLLQNVLEGFSNDRERGVDVFAPITENPCVEVARQIQIDQNIFGLQRRVALLETYVQVLMQERSALIRGGQVPL